MQITIECDGVIRTYNGDYDVLHNRDWDETIRDILDTVKDSKAE